MNGYGILFSNGKIVTSPMRVLANEEDWGRRFAMTFIDGVKMV
jgi:hypothetical protein